MGSRQTYSSTVPFIPGNDRTHAPAAVYKLKEKKFRECFKDGGWQILIFQAAYWLSSII